jgi:pimeloyl-ACP methyl ester carboxylesterase
VAGIVLMSAVVVPAGSSLRDTHFTPAMWAMTAGLARASGNGAYRYPAELILNRWLHELPRNAPAVRFALERFTAQPARPWVDRVGRERAWTSVPRAYIRCLRDIAIPPARQLAYARSLGVEPIDLDLGHDAMLSHPERVADVLLAHVSLIRHERVG